MKDVIISIQPQWVEKIATGKKTVEVRKTRPKINTPFKCYIYETKAKKQFYSYIEACECPRENDRISFWEYGSGKIIGEFICDTVYNFVQCGAGIMFADEELNQLGTQLARDMTGLTDAQIDDYLGDKDGYGWHISDLNIYDNPKELSEFNLTRPPQSWCYVKGE